LPSDSVPRIFFSREGGSPILRNLRREDIAGALELASFAGWNQVADDWALFLDIAGEGRSPSKSRLPHRDVDRRRLRARLRLGGHDARPPDERGRPRCADARGCRILPLDAGASGLDATAMGSRSTSGSASGTSTWSSAGWDRRRRPRGPPRLPPARADRIEDILASTAKVSELTGGGHPRLLARKDRPASPQREPDRSMDTSSSRRKPVLPSRSLRLAERGRGRPAPGLGSRRSRPPGLHGHSRAERGCPDAGPRAGIEPARTLWRMVCAGDPAAFSPAVSCPAAARIGSSLSPDSNGVKSHGEVCHEVDAQGVHRIRRRRRP